MFAKVLTWLKWLFGVVPKSAIGSAVVYRVIHYTLVFIIFLILGIFSNSIMRSLGLPQMDHPGFEWVDRFWCGFVFLLGYAIVRIVLYLLTILGIEEEGEFMDIDRPWEKAMTALEDEGLSIDDLPLFLVNGFTPQQEQSVFQESSGIDWLVVSPPSNETNAPLRIFANSDAIFISCTGIGSVSCQQGKVVTGQPGGGGRPGAAPIGVGNQTQVAGAPGSILGAARAGTGTIVGGAPPPTSTPPTPPKASGTVPAGGLAGAGSVPPPAAPVAAAPPPPTPARAGGTLKSIGAAFAQATMSPGGVQRAMKSFASAGAQEKGYGKKQVAPIDDIETEIGRRRMEYLCEKIREARKPYCPINGFMQAVPCSWALAEDYAKKLAPAIRHDVEIVHESLQLQFPVVVVFSELDSLPGLKEFLVRLERIQRGIRNSRAGSRFWPGATIDAKSVELVLDRAMNWFRGWIYAAFADDIGSSENQSLFHLLCSIRQRKGALEALLRGSLYQVADPEVRLSGCYFSATGAGATEQGFIRGVLDRLVEMEEEVAWSPELSHSLSKQTMISRLLIAGTVLLAAANAFIIYHLTQRGQ